MIESAFHNGINFSTDFSRSGGLIDYDNQRVKNYLNRDVALNGLHFLNRNDNNNFPATLKIYSDAFNVTISQSSVVNTPDGDLYFFNIPTDYLQMSGLPIFFEIEIDGNFIFSEIYEIQNNKFFVDNSIAHITAYNNNARHGFATLAKPAFGFFKYLDLKAKFFINKKTEYEYSYGRKKILSSENNMGRRLRFIGLTMYQQILLEWLCNTENLFIDGIGYHIISDFTQLLNEESSELCDMQADFVPILQSFFQKSSAITPKNVFPTNFFL